MTSQKTAAEETRLLVITLYSWSEANHRAGPKVLLHLWSRVGGWISRLRMAAIQGISLQYGVQIIFYLAIVAVKTQPNSDWP